MDCKLYNLLSFVAGAAIGSVVTWKLIEKKYQQIAEEEIESVKEVYSSKRPSIDDCVDEIIRQTDDKPSVLEYAAKISELGYNGKNEKAEETNEGKEEEDSMDDEPYVISMEEFEEGDYTAETLTLYSDGVLTNWYDDVIDPDEFVGRDAVDNFDKYADGDTVYVRNDNLEVDYEIQRDLRNYADVVDEKESADE